MPIYHCSRKSFVPLNTFLVFQETICFTKQIPNFSLKEVDDFLSIDKQKIFAVAYSALQQVDKNQQALQKKVTQLEATIESLIKRLDTLESK